MIFDDDDDLEMLGYGSPWESGYAVSMAIRHEKMKAYDRERRPKNPRRRVPVEVQREGDLARGRRRRAAMGVEAVRAENRRYQAEWRKRQAEGRRSTIYVCEQCGCSWERKPGISGRKPKYCSSRCANRASWAAQQKKAKAAS